MCFSNNVPFCSSSHIKFVCKSIKWGQVWEWWINIWYKVESDLIIRDKGSTHTLEFIDRFNFNQKPFSFLFFHVKSEALCWQLIANKHNRNQQKEIKGPHRDAWVIKLPSCNYTVYVFQHEDLQGSHHKCLKKCITHTH